MGHKSVQMDERDATISPKNTVDDRRAEQEFRPDRSSFGRRKGAENMADR